MVDAIYDRAIYYVSSKDKQTQHVVIVCDETPCQVLSTSASAVSIEPNRPLVK